MSTRLRAWLTLASIAALIALWSVVAFTGGFRFPYEEYVEAVAIYGSAGLFGLVLLLWRPPRFHGVRMDDPARISTDLVRRFGLRVEGKALVGESDGIEMHVSFGLQGRPHITLFGCGPIELSPQGMIARANDLRLGDEKFDRLATVKGDAAACHAALDDRTRRQWLAAAEQMPGLALSGGALRGTFADTPGISGEVEGAIRNLLSVAKRLRDVDVVAGLAANAESDSMPGVRLGCLRLLFTRYNDRPDCRRALEAALRDLDPEIRLFAAARCGRTGFDVLDALARDAHRPEAIRVEAARHALRLFPAERAQALAVALLHDTVEAVRAVARVHAEKGGAEAGQLAVAPSEQGDLSLAENAGAVSVVPRPQKTTT